MYSRDYRIFLIPFFLFCIIAPNFVVNQNTMKIFKAEDVKKIDEYTIENEPVPSIDLMERAATVFVRKFMFHYKSSYKVLVIAGPGNNGGDGLAIARMLSDRFYRVEVFILKFGSGFSNDFEENRKLLEQSRAEIKEVDREEDLPKIDENCIVIDAIFGSGLSRKVTGLPAAAIKSINKSGAEVVSVDIPSGLFGEDNRDNDVDAIVKANFTISFEFPFLSFFFPENEEFVGRWEAPSIGLHPEAIERTPTRYYLITREDISKLFKRRSKYSHKGSFGHALLIAGCDGMMGAAVLAVKAALRTGAGLVTAHVPRNSYAIVQISVPEALISIDQSDIIFTDLPDLASYTAVGVGPGLSCRKNTGKGIEKLIRTAEVPLVLDADALNILASNKEWFNLIPEGTILTPHPREFDRLFGTSGSIYDRHMKQLEMTEKMSVIIVLKGANTIITMPDGNTWINNSGNPGMATGGSGDVLTGMIVSLIAQGYSSEHAAILGVYLHGLAGDLALEHQSMESLIPGDIINYIGKAFKFAVSHNKS
jgi:NAD(P)H-hydrate epimerase